MKRLAEITFLFLMFFYFISYLTGRLDIRILESGDPFENNVTLLDEEGNSETVTEEENSDVSVEFRPGLIQKVVHISTARDFLEDPLLESDARPEKLFRNLERAHILNVFLLTAVSAWSVLMILTLYAVIRKHWFSRPMLALVLIPTVIALLGIMGILRKSELQSVGYHPVIIAWATFETILLAGSIWILFGLAFPPLPSLLKSLRYDFMDHMRKRRTSFRAVLRAGMQISYHIFLIAIAALVLSNLFLLPVYIMQTEYPGLFAGILVFGLLSLAFFYIMAYSRVSRSQGGKPDPLTALSFLGFRFINNGLFLMGIAAVVVVIFGLVIVSALLNIEALQSIHLLARPEGI